MTNIPIPRATDETIIGFFEQLRTQLGFQVAQVRILGSNQNQPLNGSTVEELGKSTGFVVTYCDAHLPQFVNVQFNRADQALGAFDRLTVNPSQNPLSSKQAIQLEQVIERYFRQTAPSAAAIYGDTSPFREIIASHEQVVFQLEKSLSKVTQNIGKTLDELGTKYSAQRLALEQEFHSLREKETAEFDLLKAKLNADYEEKYASIAEREKHLNDRDNTHVRRDIREQMKRKLQEHAKEFTLTKSTKQLRLPIHAVAVASLLALACYTFALSSKIDLSSPGALLLMIKPALLTIAALGILTWYIRWMNRWFEQHADAEFYLKQFDLDIDRASLVVETAMEWKASQQADIPSSLLESLTRNLFVRTERQDSNEMHPADYLASAILGNASRARLKFGNAELDYSKGALRKAANAVESE